MIAHPIRTAKGIGSLGKELFTHPKQGVVDLFQAVVGDIYQDGKRGDWGSAVGRALLVAITLGVGKLGDVGKAAEAADRASVLAKAEAAAAKLKSARGPGDAGKTVTSASGGLTDPLGDGAATRVVQQSARDLRVGGQPVEPGTGIARGASEPAAPRAYSVAYEMQLAAEDLGRSRSVHFNRANTRLAQDMAESPDLGDMMEQLIPGVRESVSPIGRTRTPKDWAWEHAPTTTTGGRIGIMRLVPGAQHTPGSSWWRVIHPDYGARGGYAEWAVPAGAPPNGS